MAMPCPRLDGTPNQTARQSFVYPHGLFCERSVRASSFSPDVCLLDSLIQTKTPLAVLYHHNHVRYDLPRTKGLSPDYPWTIPGLSLFRRHLDSRDGLAFTDSSFFRTTFEVLLIVTLVYIFIRRVISFANFSTPPPPGLGHPDLDPSDFVRTCFYPGTLLTLLY